MSNRGKQTGDDTIRKRLNKLMKDNGIPNVTAFAKAVKVPRPTVSAWFNKDKCPDASNLKQVCEVMGISADWLIGLSDIRNPGADEITRGACAYLGLSDKAVDNLRSLTSELDHAPLGIRDFYDVTGALDYFLGDTRGVQVIAELFDYLFAGFDTFWYTSPEHETSVLNGGRMSVDKNGESRLLPLTPDVLAEASLNALMGTLRAWRQEVQRAMNNAKEG